MQVYFRIGMIRLVANAYSDTNNKISGIFQPDIFFNLYIQLKKNVRGQFDGIC